MFQARGGPLAATDRGSALEVRVLADLTLVPVLAPADTVFGDPVPADGRGRDLFRPQPALEVRSWADFYVQDREFTMRQYAALLASEVGPV